MALADAIHTDDLAERLLVVRQIPHLESLGPADRAAVASLLRERTFRRGESLARENERAESFFVLVEGRVRLTRGGKYFRTVDAPGAVGYMAMLARTPSASGAVAETDVRAFELDRDAQYEIYEDHSSALLGSIHLVATRLLEELKAQPNPVTVHAVSTHDPAFVDPGRPLDLVERIFFLRTMRAFASSNVNALAELSQRLEELRFAPDEIVWRAGDAADYTLLLVSGKVEYTTEDGRASTFRAGSAVGGAESLANAPRWNTLRAVEPTLALRGGREVMLDVFEDNHDVALDFLGVLATALLRFWDQRAQQESAGG
jgi:CRP-like cAMP-binding protein